MLSPIYNGTPYDIESEFLRALPFFSLELEQLLDELKTYPQGINGFELLVWIEDEKFKTNEKIIDNKV